MGETEATTAVGRPVRDADRPSVPTAAALGPGSDPPRVALVGKGGAGKSVIAGTLARLIGRRVGRVLLLDSDPMPGLAMSLGVEPDDAGIPDEAVEDGPEGGPRYVLRDGWTPEALAERAATRAPDGVRLLQVGKTRGTGLSQPALHAYQQVVDALVPGAAPTRDAGLEVRLGERPTALAEWSVVGDLPGGTRQPFMGWGRFAELFLVVVEPTAKSVLAARRLAHLAGGWSHGRAFHVAAVANKAREDADAAWVAEHTGLEVVAAVPWDEELAAAERAGRSPLDHAPGSPAVSAITALADRIVRAKERT